MLTIIASIVILGFFGYVIYCYVGTSHIKGGRQAWEYKDKESARRADEWRQKCWDQIEREKKAKERREKRKRYYDGYDD